MHLRKFNELGYDEFTKIYSDIYNSVIKKGWEKGFNKNHRDELKTLLDDDKCSELIDENISLDKTTFNTAYEFGDYLEKKFKGIDQLAIEQDKYFWDWLALYYFEILIPKTGKFASKHRYFLSDDWQTRNRHLVRTPWYLKVIYGEYSKLLSSVPTNQGGDWREQFISHRECEKFTLACEIAYKLYYDEERSKPLEGYSKRWVNRKGIKTEVSASLGRLISQLKQYSQVYNINSMSADDFISLLGKEFDNLKEK
jgi:hypothetical protein